MSRVLDRAVRLALAMVVAGGLGFGVRSATAASGTATACGEPFVTCGTNAFCNDICKQYYGPESGGGCVKGCCICAL